MGDGIHGQIQYRESFNSFFVSSFESNVLFEIIGMCVRFALRCSNDLQLV